MPAVTLSKEGLEKLRGLLGSFRGVDLSYYTESFLARRVHARMHHIGLSGDPSKYIDLLTANHAELEAFGKSLTINVTEFFRNADTYEAIRAQVLPILMAGGPRRIQAWSAGCATGEEPYALAMILDEALSRKPGWSFVVHASDISPKQLEAAEKATYPAEAVRKVPERLARRYLVDAGGGRVAIEPSLRAHVRFHQHDLSSGRPIKATAVDLILCRNVMIYFSPEARAKLLAMFHRTLAREGFLVLGGSELILRDDFFSSFEPKLRIYRAAARPAAGER